MHSPDTLASPRPLAAWSGLHAALVWAYAGTPPDYARQAWVTAPFYSAYHVYEGRLLIRDDQGSIKAGPGQWLLPRPGWRWQECDACTRILSLRFRVKWPTGEDLFEDYPAIALGDAAAPELRPAGEALYDFILGRWGERRIDTLAAPSDLAGHLGLQSRLHVWLEAWARVSVDAGARARRGEPPDERLKRVIDFLDTRPLSEGLPSEPYLARLATLSVTHLNRLFARQLKMSPREYLERRRLSVAILAVEEGDQPFKTIAADLGFSSPPHFTRWFGKRTGLAPAAFRLRARNNPRGRFPDPLHG